jgi:hypothetical protein
MWIEEIICYFINAIFSKIRVKRLFKVWEHQVPSFSPYIKDQAFFCG